MLKSKNIVGLFFGLLVALIIWNINIDGLSTQGQKCLALSLMTVIFWATNVAHPGYTSGLYLALLVIFRIAPTQDIFSLWSSSIVYLVMGAYLIAGSAKSSGLGERIAYNFIIRFINSYNSIIYSIFILTFILSLLIPHPWPRAFLIMSVFIVVIKSANLSCEDAKKIGFTVFAASVPVSMIFLTGDSSINIMAIELSGVKLNWFGWLYYMGIPAVLASVLTMLLILKLFKPEKKVEIDKKQIRAKLIELGPLCRKERKTMLWIILAIVLWMTDSIHGIEIGWATLIVAMLMSFPVIGVLDTRDWQQVPIEMLIFFTAAIAIGRVGGITGMNTWIASVILPEFVPTNLFLFALFIAAVSIFLHMLLGSVIGVMGIAIPLFMVFTEQASLNPLVPALFVYTATAMHYILPFQHLDVLVGIGEGNGLYNEKHVIKLGIPLTFAVFLVVIFEVSWWKLTGIL